MGLVARHLEENGLPTITIASARDITALVKPPRTVFVDFPLGNPLGLADDVGLQRSILRDAFRALDSIRQPGTIVDLPYQWSEDPNWKAEAWAGLG